MKSFWRQYRLSASLDDGKTQSAPYAPAESKELRQFAQDLAAVDSRLAAEQPDLGAPRFLHGSIMAKVRSCSEARSGQLNLFVKWWPAPACAAALIACLLAAVYIARKPAPVSPAASLQKDLASLPGTVLSPLSEELQNLHRDLENTTAFLLASVP